MHKKISSPLVLLSALAVLILPFTPNVANAAPAVDPVIVDSLWGNDYQMCVILSNGEVTCWGMNGYGSLGGGSDAQTQLPVKVAGVSDATAVAIGNSFACALITDGTVKCWGANGSGQLGNGSTSDSLSPVTVQGINNATAVAAGYGHACAILQGGGVQCWGDNYYGQVGDGSYSSRYAPVSVSLPASATQIDAQVRTSCAVLSTGAIYCWGSNDWGMLGAGRGSPGNWTSTKSSSPIAVSGISNAVTVDVGAPFVCALLTTAAVKCWGSNGEGGAPGTLGNGQSSGSSNVPVDVVGINDATSLSTGTAGGCVIRSNQTVKCWGSRYPSTPTDVNGLTGVSSIRVGSEHICVMVPSGRVQCWGRTDVLGRSSSFSSSWYHDSPIYVPLTFQEIDFPNISSSSIDTLSKTISATSTSRLETTFSSLTPTICSISAQTITFQRAGTCSIMSSQPGNDIFVEAPSVTKSFEITGTTPSITSATTQNVWIEDAIISTSVNSGGLSTAVKIEYGLSPSLSGNVNISDESNVIGAGDSTTQIMLSGLLTSTTYYYRVLASNSLGETRSSIQSFSTRPPIGISINDAADYTVDANVELSISWPAGATAMIVSNDGGFRTKSSKSMDVAEAVSWKIDDALQAVYTKVVYVRFSGPGIDSSRTYSDDIVLDNRAPVVSTVSAQLSGSYVVLSMGAKDKESGIESVEISNGSNSISTEYASTIAIPTKEIGMKIAKTSGAVTAASTKGLKIRVSDRAGNRTRWISLSKKTKTTSGPRPIDVGTKITATAIALSAKLKVKESSKTSLKVDSKSRKFCRVSDSSLIGVKAGVCRVTVSVKEKKGKPILKTLSIKVQK